MSLVLFIFIIETANSQSKLAIAFEYGQPNEWVVSSSPIIGNRKIESVSSFEISGWHQISHNIEAAIGGGFGINYLAPIYSVDDSFINKFSTFTLSSTLLAHIFKKKINHPIIEANSGLAFKFLVESDVYQNRFATKFLTDVGIGYQLKISNRNNVQLLVKSGLTQLVLRVRHDL